MKKIPGILLQIMEGLFMADAIQPFFAGWREVDVALNPGC
jgi:hypothetical protein